MMLSFKNRIAFFYLMATALLTAIAFSVIFFIVKSTVYNNIDNDLNIEIEKHSKDVKFTRKGLKVINRREWLEREHREIQVNPVFIQITNKKGEVIYKTPNLKEEALFFINGEDKYLNKTLGNRSIRQLQMPIQYNGKIEGFIIAGMSLEASKMVLSKLGTTLVIVYIVLLGVLYFVSRYLAGRSISPVRSIIKTVNRITKNNLNERVPLPPYKDELFHVSSSINQLLQRIEDAMERERQFTSDASHELRTPLASLRGTLEVLIRKPRTQEEYSEKIKYSLAEIDRMAAIIEQLLLLARLDIYAEHENRQTILLATLIDEILIRYHTEIERKELKVNTTINVLEDVYVPQYYSNLILDNIINNAIKYSKSNTTIHIIISKEHQKIICTVADQGIGINKEDIVHIFNHFFRSEALNHKHISGNGLGLSIVKKAAKAIKAEVTVTSQIGRGTIFTIIF